MSKALVVFSGGQDSTTCLGIARHMGYECHAIGFNYGQRHAVELEQAKKIADKLEVPFTIVDIREFGKLVSPGTALVGDGLSLSSNYEEPASVSAQSPLPQFKGKNIPASFVPNRNAVMLTIAHGFAQLIGASVVFTGVCETDYSGYPDCRERFIARLNDALNVGYETGIQIITPLMYASKGETFKMAEDTGVLDLVLDESHTCYEGVRGTAIKQDEEGRDYVAPGRYDWGHGCGECPACKLRAKGWADYKALMRIDQGNPQAPRTQG